MGETICLVFLLIPSIRVLWIFADWETLSGWVTPLGKPISQFRDSIAKKERKGKKKTFKNKTKQNKPNTSLYGNSAHALFSAMHKLNIFNCLFLCQKLPVQRDAIWEGTFYAVSVPGAMVLVFPGLSIKHIFSPAHIH